MLDFAGKIADRLNIKKFHTSKGDYEVARKTNHGVIVGRGHVALHPDRRTQITIYRQDVNDPDTGEPLQRPFKAVVGNIARRGVNRRRAFYNALSAWAESKLG